MLCRRCATRFVDGIIMFLHRYDAGPSPDLLMLFENVKLSSILRLLAIQSYTFEKEDRMSPRKTFVVPHEKV